MDLYVLDPNTFLPSQPVEGFTSLVWTERYSEPGDISVEFPWTDDFKQIIKEYVFLGIPQSKEVCMITEITTDAETGLATATGKSLVDILSQRMLRDTYKTGTTYSLTYTPTNIARQLVYQMCTSAGVMASNQNVIPTGPNEIINGLSVQPSTAGGTSVTYAAPYGQVYDAVKEISDSDGLGFTIQPVQDGSGNTVFISYRGTDRTTSQTAVPPVLFETALDNFTDTSEVHSIAEYKNVAYAFGSTTADTAHIGIAYQGSGSSSTNWSRRTLFVDASDIDSTKYSDTAYKAALNQAAANALANNNYSRSVDGTVIPQKGCIYGTDYFIGDIIELRNDTTTITKARVTEYIRTSDSTGETSYPTLVAL